MLEKTWESLGQQGNQSNQFWKKSTLGFIGRTDAEAEARILCPSDVKNWLIGKDADAGKDWGHSGKRVTEEEMVVWHHWLSGDEFEQTPGKPGMLQFLGSQRVGHDLATEHTQAYLKACQIQSQWVLSLQQMNWEKRGDSIHDSFHIESESMVGNDIVKGSFWQ